MKKILFISSLVSIILFTYSCGDDKPNADATEKAGGNQPTKNNPDYDAKRGTGKFKNVTSLQRSMLRWLKKGTKYILVKCSACHKLTDEKLVGPGMERCYIKT